MTRALASIIIPSRDSPELLEVVLAGLAATSWARYEVILVDHDSRTPRTARTLREATRRDGTVVRVDGEFNFSRLINAGAAVAQGEVLVLLNDDIEITGPGWLDALMEPALAPGAGPVGALLRYPDRTVQHCGITLQDGVPAHMHTGLPVERLPAEHACAGPRMAVTGACLAIRTGLFRALGGMEPLLRTSYNDVDLCLRALSWGHIPYFTPAADLVHHESATRGRDATPEVRADWLMFRTRWRTALGGGDIWAPHAGPVRAAVTPGAAPPAS